MYHLKYCFHLQYIQIAAFPFLVEFSQFEDQDLLLTVVMIDYVAYAVGFHQSFYIYIYILVFIYIYIYIYIYINIKGFTYWTEFSSIKSWSTSESRYLYKVSKHIYIYIYRYKNINILYISKGKSDSLSSWLIRSSSKEPLSVDQVRDVLNTLVYHKERFINK